MQRRCLLHLSAIAADALPSLVMHTLAIPDMCTYVLHYFHALNLENTKIYIQRLFQMLEMCIRHLLFTTNGSKII